MSGEILTADQFDDAFARHLPEGSHPSQGSQPAPRLERDVTDVTDVTDFGAPAKGDERLEQETLGAAWDRLKRERGEPTA